jgi:hypothetical protein
MWRDLDYERRDDWASPCDADANADLVAATLDRVTCEKCKTAILNYCGPVKSHGRAHG